MVYFFRKLIAHYASATLIDVLHSPFVFSLYNQCFKKNSIIRLTSPLPPSSGYYDKRVKSIIEKMKVYFAGHHFTTDIDSLPAGKPFMLLADDLITADKLAPKLQEAHNDSVVIVQNMYANEAATQQWEDLKKRSTVTASIDLFFMGMVFVRKEQRKQTFRLRLF